MATMLATLALGVIALSGIDFDSDGTTAVMLSRCFMRQDGIDVMGVVTSVLYRSGRSWRLRMQLFEEPQPYDGRSLLRGGA